eukprot:TRINITY_DN8602_c0_g1_i1.p1 TRINITY_DN8602_c0_g1~~TRINITY_DN8602_c0_g1_i1.p1  ORF type:complete len:122 (+),score=41.80 TRINITY_DN8602_c0_g1_i1:54-419(+)
MAEGFMERVAAWYMEGTLQDDLDSFLETYGKEVVVGDGEQTHRNKELFDMFSNVLESCLKIFCKKEGITDLEFYKRCEEEYQENATNKQILAAILAAASYEAFISLVADWKEEQEEEKEKS